MAHRPSPKAAVHLLAIALITLLAVSCGSVPRTVPPLRARRQAPRFEGDFEARLRSADPSRRFVALVDLTDQVDLRALARRRSSRSPSKAEVRAAVISALEDVAFRQQAKLRPLLARLTSQGSIGSVKQVAVVNRLVVEGTAEGLFALAASREVAIVRPDWTGERAAGATSPEDGAGPLPPSFRSWAIDAMKADRLWRAGWNGSGVVVASIDTGAYEAHEQLRGHRVEGRRGWFDPVEGSTMGTDRHGHGTGVLSQAVGGNPGDRLVGIAPSARWAVALGNWRNFYARSRMTLAADWILRVARPDVAVNAWSHDEGTCSDFDRPFIDAWKASGIFVVFPAGNRGPQRASGESPAQIRGIFPDGGGVFSVAALAPAGGPLAMSSRGPSRCGSADFPTIAAPGAGLPLAALGAPDAYLRGDGTSLSAGLVGGAAAILLQAFPETDPERLERVLAASTRDVLPAGHDDATGAGAIDLEAALALLNAD